MSYSKTFLILFGLLFTTVVSAQKSRPKPHYYLLFSARFPTLRPFSIGGHAFLTWRMEDSAAKKYEQFTYGFGPAEGSGIFKKVKGEVLGGYIKNSKRERLMRRFIIEIDSSDYSNTLKEINIWKTQSYSLYRNNCVHFMNSVASKTCLETVSTKSCIIPKYPYRYIKQLKKKNRLRIIKNTYLERVRLRILKKADAENEIGDDDD